MGPLQFEFDVFAGVVRSRLSADPGYVALQTIPGIAPTLAAVFVAEIEDVRRFDGPDKLTSWSGLTPRHRESDTHVHCGRISKQGSQLVRSAAVESAQVLSKTSALGAFRDRISAKQSRKIGVAAAARRRPTWSAVAGGRCFNRLCGWDGRLSS